MARYIEETEIYKLVEPHGTAKVHCSQIDELLRADVVPKSEVESIITLNSQLEAKVFEQRKEIGRLHGILLQFTDIVHKWGAKNNIDTSEISLVPILQEEADSVIKKANQELASEIFAEIDNIRMIERTVHKRGLEGCYNFDSEYEKLKKKYTEGEDKPASEEKHFSPEDVRNMTPQEVREKYSAIRRSMERW